MSSELGALILLGSFLLLVVIKMPVSLSMIASTALTMLCFDIPLMTLVQQMAKAINSFSLMAIPFFLLMGEIMNAGGISDRIVRFANALVGRFRGGLAMVNVLDSMFFGGISGSAVADVSSLGSIVIPMMEKAGYDRSFATALTVTSSCQGVLIPPSHNMIFFAVAAGGVSVGRLFLGGVIPGVTLGLGLMVYVVFLSFRRNFPKGEPVPFKALLKVTWEALLALMVLVIIMVGVAAGIFTATESAAIACIYAFFVATFIYRDLKISMVPRILLNTVKTLAMVFTLIAAAGAFAWVLSYLKIPGMITNALLAISHNKVILLLLINVMLLVLGMIMDMGPLILIVTPILLPVMRQIGISDVHFGVLLIFNLAVGLCTPPVGSALFVGCAVSKSSIEDVTKALLPQYAVMIVALMLVTFIPALSNWLPNLIMGR